MEPFFFTPYNYDQKKHSKEHALFCKDPTLARQEFKDECDINFLFERYLETGEMPQITDFPTYGDFTGTFDYQSAMNTVNAGQRAFMQLPAKHRARFSNDPGQFLAFLEDPENWPEAEKMGIVKVRQEEPQVPEKPEVKTPESPKT